MKYCFTICFVCGILIVPLLSVAQKTQSPVNVGATFLLINPDARSAGMGDVVTGIEPDPNALFGNAAKLLFAGNWGISANYSPWMRDMNNNKSNLGYLSAYKTWNGSEGVGLSMKFFDHGQITFRDDNGTMMQNYHAVEYAIDGTYARKLGDHLGLALTIRYIRSQLGAGAFNGLQQKPGSAVAGDVGLYYQNSADNLDFGNRYCWGISFTNIGTKLKYTDDTKRQTFLPMNLRIGGGYTFVHTQEHQFALAVDINKLLVPTPPIYKVDAGGQITNEIEKGRNPDRSVAETIFSSFTDAPGGFQEELREFTVASGLEYTYQHQFFARVGYFYEHPNKGYRQHFSAGLGVRVKALELDMAYLMPTDGSQQERRTLRFSLVYNISNDK
ncbi:type IX secretion system outer membrane channel protein PorV [Chitinophaga defluvii]|uniref:Type IX secretion system outer membrane channel protein PorV n=1 Tax=Chitinophaga defluvii TaxID=3163343 RepID=A0ABV2TBY5_9BACT